MKNKTKIYPTILISLLVFSFFLYYFYSNMLFNKIVDNYKFTPSKSQIIQNINNYKQFEWNSYYLDSHEIKYITFEKLYFINDSLLFSNRKSTHFGFKFPLLYLLKSEKYDSYQNLLYKVKKDTLYLISKNGTLIKNGMLKFNNGQLIITDYVRP